MSIRRLVCIVCAGALGLSGVAAGVGLLRPRRSGPSISIATPVIELGRVKPGQELFRRISIVNAGGTKLTLEEPTASCGCQKPVLRALSLAPGESTELEVTQTASPRPGPFQHAIFLRSNDPRQPEARIFLRGTVTIGVVVRPEPLVLGTIRTGQQVQRVLEVLSDEGKPFRITFLNTSGPITARDLTEGAAALHRIEVKSTSGHALGPFRAQVVVNVDTADSPTLIIPVVGTVAGQVQVMPSALTLGTMEGYSERTLELVLRGGLNTGDRHFEDPAPVPVLKQFPEANGPPLRVVDVRPPSTIWKSRFEVLETKNDLSAVRVRVTLNAPNIANELDGNIWVIVEHSGKQEELTIPVTGTIIETTQGDEQHAAQRQEPGVHAD